MSANEQKDLKAQADEILAQAGYWPDGRPKSEERDRSLHAISTPCGGRTDRYRK
jgi:hypothetical protein